MTRYCPSINNYYPCITKYCPGTSNYCPCITSYCPLAQLSISSIVKIFLVRFFNLKVLLLLSFVLKCYCQSVFLERQLRLLVLIRSFIYNSMFALNLIGQNLSKLRLANKNISIISACLYFILVCFAFKCKRLIGIFFSTQTFLY